MKKFLSTILILSIYATMNVLPAYSSVDLHAVTTKQSQIIKLQVDGKEKNYSIKWNNEHNRLLIESDFIVDCFGANVFNSGNNIDITKGNHKLHFEIDNEFYLMDDFGGRKIGCLAEINKDKVYLPIRYICEAFGALINYDDVTNTVHITSNAIVMNDSIKKYFENVQVFDQSTIRITGEKTIYVDPRRVLGQPKDADIIFITHTHNDHYEVESIKNIIKPSTVIYITMDGVEQAKKDGFKNVIGVEPNMDYEENGIRFSTISAYNTDEERQNHKKELNWVGYIFTINGYTYYSAGDSDFTEEMKNIDKSIDVAFLPIDGKYNMDFIEAAKAANTIMPKVAVPYHYNNFISEDKAKEFVDLLNDGIDGAIVTFKMQ